MASRPGFVKIHRPSCGDENLRIPSRFIQSIQGNELKNVSLRDRYNNLWLVKVEMAGSYFYFKDGWTKFTDDNMIEEGNLIVYEYFSHGILDFKVYDHSDCLTKGVGGHMTTEVENRQDDHPQEEQVMGGGEHHCFSTSEEENQGMHLFEVEEVTDDDSADDDCIRAIEDNNDIDDQRKRANVMDDDDEVVHDINCKCVPTAREVDPKRSQKKDKRKRRKDSSSHDHRRGGQVRDESGSTSSTKKRSKRDHDWYGEALFRSGVVQQPRNAYFVTKKKKSRVGELLVPNEVIKVYNLQLPESILLIDPEERQFRATRKVWSDGRTHYAGGWKTLCAKNSVEDEHIIICELVRIAGEFCIRVSFFLPPKG